jgi:carboxypeptidase family protein
MFLIKSLAPSLALMLITSAVAQDRSTGTIKGKVKVEVGTPAGVAVIVKQGDREISQTATDKNGEFVTRVPPGTYGLTFRKAGLSVGTMENVEVKAGKTRSLGDRLVLTIDEGSIAFIRGSVFNHEGRSVPGARVELARIQKDGSARKIDGRITNETGSFVFRLMPDVAKYRLTAKLSGGDAVSKDIEVDGPAVYRVALSLPPTPK